MSTIVEPPDALREGPSPLAAGAPNPMRETLDVDLLWIDGVEAASIANGEGGWPVQPASPQMFVGSMGLQGGETAVWIDDVAAGPQRIGCN